MKNGKKYNKNNHIKSYSIGILLLTNISLLSFGFSSWYSGISSPISASVDLTIGETSEVGNFLNLNSEIEMFEFCDKGIIDSKNEMIVSTGDIYVGFNLNVTNLKETLQTYYDYALDNLTRFYISTTLSHTYTLDALFKTYLQSVTLGMSTSDVTTYDISPVVDPTISSNTYEAKFLCSLTDENITSLNFKIKYSFDFQNKFATDVYPKLSHNALMLNFKVEVEL